MSPITLETFGSGDQKLGYIAWSPVPLTVSGTSTSGTRSVTLKSRSLDGSISRVVFIANAGDEPADEITINLGAANRAVVFVAGKFQENAKHKGASEDSKDVAVEAAWSDHPTQVAGSLDLMIRVRKNANDLSEKARRDFLDALATLNGIQTSATPTPGPGKGVYVTDFVGMHVRGASLSEHGDSMFLPWHRLYLLDLERLLQQVNPAVTLPYWKFDEAAPNVFSEDFMGATESVPPPPTTPFTQGTSDKYAQFAATNPLSQWKIGDANGIQRAAFFDTTQPSGLELQVVTLGLGNPGGEFGAWINSNPTKFSRIEAGVHGDAHVSFNGFINFVPVAPRDPLFFLLHCNVDRLWAVWQLLYQRDTASEQETYPYQSGADTPHPWKIIDATQWPWDDSKSVPGQLAPPGTRKTNFTPSPTGKQMAGGIPLLMDAIDPLGLHDPANDLGFAFDDAPFNYQRFSAPPVP